MRGVLRKQSECRWTIQLLLAVALLTAGGGFAHAGVQDSMFAIGAHANFYSTDEADSSDVLGGAHAKLRLTSGFMIEGAIDYRRQEFVEGAVKVDGYPVQLSLLWYIFKGGVIGKAGPHLIFGGTWYNAKVSFSDWDYSSSEFGYHGGFGLDIGFGDHVSITGDVRYQFLDVNTDQFRIDHDGLITRLGLTFWF